MQLHLDALLDTSQDLVEGVREPAVVERHRLLEGLLQYDAKAEMVRNARDLSDSEFPRRQGRAEAIKKLG